MPAEFEGDRLRDDGANVAGPADCRSSNVFWQSAGSQEGLGALDPASRQVRAGVSP